MSNIRTVKQGFTLAEVLVTLAIIGIVAALTIPALITSYNENVTATQAKKVFSTISSAWNLYIEEHGGSPVGTFPSSSRFDYRDYFLEKYFSYIQESDFGVNTHSIQSLRDDTLYLTLDAGITTTDGVIISIYNASNSCQYNGVQDWCAQVYFDVNGIKGPNRIGYDAFYVSLMSNKVSYADPRNSDDDLVNTTCIEPGHTGWTNWTNSGMGCLKRILLNQSKWSG